MIKKDIDALHRDDVEMVGFFHVKKPKHRHHPSLGHGWLIKCLTGFRKQLDLNLKAHQAGWAIDQSDYPLFMKG